MKKIYYLVFLLYFCKGIKAQQWNWAKFVDTTQTPMSNCLTNGNGTDFYLTTNFLDSQGYNSGTCITKFDGQGNALWKQCIGGNATISDIVFKNNILYMTGAFSDSSQVGNTLLISNGGADVFAASISDNGNFNWAKNFGGPQDDLGNGICSDATGNIYLTGGYSGAAVFGTSTLVCQGGSNMFMVKLNASGNVLLAKSAGCMDNTGSSGSSIKTDAAGNIFVLGGYRDIVLDTTHLVGDYYFGSSFLCRFDAAGNAQWLIQAATGTSNVDKLVMDHAGNLLTLGTGAWTNGSWIVYQKFNSTGQIVYGNSITGTCYGDGYVHGGTVIENGSSNNSFMIATGGRSNCTFPHDKLLVRVEQDSVGHVIFRDSTIEQTSDPNNAIVSTRIITDPNNDFIICGILMDGGITLNNQLSTTSRKVFIAKFPGTNSTVGIKERKEESISVYPNPTSGVFTVKLKNKAPGTRICIYDALGNCTITKTTGDEPETEINLEHYPKGMYSIDVLSGTEKITQKVILR